LKGDDMPDKDVHTIRDEFYFQYAKIIACSAFGAANGKEAKKIAYGFIKNKFQQLQNGVIEWSNIVREDKQLIEAEKKCIYCGATDNLVWEHIVPKSLRIKPECQTCDIIQGIHNQIWACGKCNSMKATKGLYEFYKDITGDKKYYDLIPALVEKKYLKTMFSCHQCAGTLDKGNANNEQVTAIDIDSIINI
jgi:ribosomal protein S27AE